MSTVHNTLPGARDVWVNLDRVVVIADTMCVHGFLRDIAQDNDYEIYAANNWWDDLEKFGAVNARFLAVRHGLRFELTLHTAASWDAFTTHGEYMRRKFDTVIKTDVLFSADTQKVQQAKEDMRREEMWRERWARIHVPDRALTIGTLRYAHVPCPSNDQLRETALRAVGQSRAALKHLQKAARKVQIGVKAMGSFRSTVQQHSPAKGQPSPVLAAQDGQHDDEDDIDTDDDDDASGTGLGGRIPGGSTELAGIGGAWVSLATTRHRFCVFRKRFLTGGCACACGCGCRWRLSGRGWRRIARQWGGLRSSEAATWRREAWTRACGSR